MDRSGGKQIDKLKIQFPELDFPPGQVGDERSMIVAFGPNRKANADLVLEIDGDQLVGEIKLRYSQVSMHVDSLSQLLGGNDVRLRINQGLNQINRFETTLSITGSLDHYTIQMSSDLGSQFILVVNSAVIDKVQQQNQQLVKKLDQRKEQLSRLISDNYEPALRQILDRTGSEIVRLSEMKQTFQSQSESGWRKLR
jgi:hypothetical protein